VHTRRVSAFFLGAWIAGCLLMIFVSLQGTRAVIALMNSPVPQAGKMIETLGNENAGLLLHHAAAEQARSALNTWELVEILLGLILGGCLYLATQRRIFPLVLCAAMLVLVLFQHFGISPELAYRGQRIDFPPGNADVDAKLRFLALEEVYYAAEVIKLVAGGILASYLFVFRSSRRRKSEVDAVDHADHRHVDR
jgi:hypothetical protein